MSSVAPRLTRWKPTTRDAYYDFICSIVWHAKGVANKNPADPPGPADYFNIPGVDRFPLLGVYDALSILGATAGTPFQPLVVAPTPDHTDDLMPVANNWSKVIGQFERTFTPSFEVLWDFSFVLVRSGSTSQTSAKLFHRCHPARFLCLVERATDPSTRPDAVTSLTSTFVTAKNPPIPFRSTLRNAVAGNTAINSDQQWTKFLQMNDSRLVDWCFVYLGEDGQFHTEGSNSGNIYTPPSTTPSQKTDGLAFSTSAVDRVAHVRMGPYTFQSWFAGQSNLGQPGQIALDPVAARQTYYSDPYNYPLVKTQVSNATRPDFPRTCHPVWMRMIRCDHPDMWYDPNHDGEVEGEWILGEQRCVQKIVSHTKLLNVDDNNSSEWTELPKCPAYAQDTAGYGQPYRISWFGNRYGSTGNPG